MNYNLPGFHGNLPWFIYDLTNLQLITSPVVPGDIADSKEIVLAEIQVPGLNYSPVFPAGNRNRKVSFQLQLVKRNNTVGNMMLLAQFANLRNAASGPLDLFQPAGQFQPNPKVLYYWGLGSPPLEWFVSKLSMTHKGEGWVNAMGNPMLSTVDIELTLDERSPLSRMEEMYRRTAALTGEITGVAGQVGGGLPY